MTKNELIRLAALGAGMSMKDEQKAIDSFLSVISDAMADEQEVVIPDFGKFFVKECAAHRVINPNTHEPMTIPATKRVRFKAYANLVNYGIKYGH